MIELVEKSSLQKSIFRINKDESRVLRDEITIEEPLEIRLTYGPKPSRTTKKISITMRTPGRDLELALGFLFTEGIISSYGQIQEICSDSGISRSQITLVLNEEMNLRLPKGERHFLTNSSCGVCGKESLESIKTESIFREGTLSPITVSKHLLFDLPSKISAAQSDFCKTGGIHASALFSSDGNLLQLMEDVGRHNALDKLIGSQLIQGNLPLQTAILLLSGRASFELIQKASMAGIQIVAAIGAPSSLAISMAEESNIALIGFLKSERFNIYHLPDHIKIPDMSE